MSLFDFIKYPIRETTSSLPMMADLDALPYGMKEEYNRQWRKLTKNRPVVEIEDIDGIALLRKIISEWDSEYEEKLKKQGLTRL